MAKRTIRMLVDSSPGNRVFWRRKETLEFEIAFEARGTGLFPSSATGALSRSGDVAAECRPPPIPASPALGMTLDLKGGVVVADLRKPNLIPSVPMKRRSAFVAALGVSSLLALGISDSDGRPPSKGSHSWPVCYTTSVKPSTLRPKAPTR